MKKLKTSILLLVTLLIAFALFSCSGIVDENVTDDEELKEEIVGTWNLIKDSEDAYSSDYPDSKLTIKEDGIWKSPILDRGHYGNGHYYIEDGIIVMNCRNWFSEREYKVSIEDGLLKLQYKGYTPVYYQRAN